jgi:hypothetical protein
MLPEHIPCFKFYKKCHLNTYHILHFTKCALKFCVNTAFKGCKVTRTNIARTSKVRVTRMLQDIVKSGLWMT